MTNKTISKAILAELRVISVDLTALRDRVEHKILPPPAKITRVSQRFDQVLDDLSFRGMYALLCGLGLHLRE